MPPDASDWLASATAAVQATPLAPRAEHRGRVEEIGDGVAMISGLRDVRLDEVLRFAGGQFGFARVLDPDLIGCVLLDSAVAVRRGMRCLAPVRWLMCPWARACWAGSWTRWAARWTVKARLKRRRIGRLNVPPRRLLSVIW